MPYVARHSNDTDPANWLYSADGAFTGVPADTDWEVAEVANWSAPVTVTADSTAPVLSSPTGVADGPTDATGTVSTTKAGGTLYFASFPGAGSTPSSAQIIAGTGGGIVSADSQAVATSGAQNVALSGLTASTAYKIAYVHVDDAITPNTSNVVASAQFTTDAELDDLLDGAGIDFTGFSVTNGFSVVGGKLVKTAGSGGIAQLDVSSLLTPATTVKFIYDMTAYTVGSCRPRIIGATTVTGDHTQSVGEHEITLTVPEKAGGTTLTIDMVESASSDAWELDNLIIVLVP
jgi:hypothetical protein